jgi:putative cell wall-binding protein
MLKELPRRVVLGLALVALTAISTNFALAAPEDLVRVAGATRFQTSARVSAQMYPSNGSASAVVLATGLDFADALNGVVLANLVNAPLMLIKPGQIDSEVWAEIQRVLPLGRTIYLLGGSAAINQAQQDFLTSQGYVVQRLSGSDRLETARAIASLVAQLRGRLPDQYYIVNGYNFPDALSISPLAAVRTGTIMPTRTAQLDQTTLNFIANNRPTSNSVTLVGGTSAVSLAVVVQLESLGLTVNRVSGQTRYDTSRQVADMFVSSTPVAPTGVGVASGETFADALPGGAHMALRGWPILLEKPAIETAGCLATSDFLQDYADRIAGGFIYGGSAVFSSASELFAEELISATRTLSCTGPTIAGCQVFPSDNPWNTDVSQYPVHANSTNYINSILAGEQFLHADFGSNPDYGIPFTTVPSTQPLVPMSFEVASESDQGPYPFPANAPVEAGSDHHVLVLRQGTCDLFETYDSTYVGPGWNAYSGARFDLNSNALRPDTWTSADAAGLPILPGLVRYDEVTAGSINHAVRFTVSQTQRAFIHPATHYASSSTDPNRPPMGLRLRLKSSFDTSGFSGEARVILEALKKYGMIVADNGTDWFITGATDSRWDDTDLDQLKTVPGSAFEAVETGPLIN